MVLQAGVILKYSAAWVTSTYMSNRTETAKTHNIHFESRSLPLRRSGSRKTTCGIPCVDICCNLLLASRRVRILLPVGAVCDWHCSRLANLLTLKMPAVRSAAVQSATQMGRPITH